MKSHNRVKKLLYEFLRGELSDADRNAVESHVAICKECSEELSALREAALLLDANITRPSDTRNDLYWQQFTENVGRRIERESKTEASIVQQILDAFLIHRKPFGVGFAAALVLVALAIGTWNLWLRSPERSAPVEGQAVEEIVGTGPVNARNAALESRAQNYLEQSKVLLIGLINTDSRSHGADSPLLQREKEISRRLVNESALITSKLNDPSQRQMKELITDLQLILVQIANLSVKQETPGIEIIKGGIEHNGILFRINLEQIQRATKPSERGKKNMKQTS